MKATIDKASDAAVSAKKKIKNKPNPPPKNREAVKATIDKASDAAASAKSLRFSL